MQISGNFLTGAKLLNPQVSILPNFTLHVTLLSRWAHLNAFDLEIVQGVPKKSVISVQMLLEAFKNELQIKVGWVLKNSGNFQSNEHRNFVFLPKIAWDIKAQSWLPSS